MFSAMFSTLYDFIPYPSIILFLPRCNLRCEYCYNHHLLTTDPLIDKEEALEYVKRSKPYIDGVVISGGEPLLHQTDEMVDFLSTLKSMDLKIKIDTNLTLPILDELVELIHGISFTVKPLKYYQVAGVNIQTIINNIRKVEVLPWKEARITVVKDLTLEDSVSIFAPYLADWSFHIHNAIVPEDGTLSEIEEMDYDTFNEFVLTHITPYLDANKVKERIYV